MLSLASPMWLLALVVIPLVWWLHCFRELGAQVSVPALFLWSPERTVYEQGLQKALRPQSIWLVRALILTLLVLALSEPRWRTAELSALTLWLDDSVSMQVVENDQTRMQKALTDVAKALTAERYSDVVLRSLGDPSTTHLLTGQNWVGQLYAFGRQHRGEPQLPAPAVMSAKRKHWLVTDGVSAGLEDWVKRAPLSHLVQAGEKRENVAVTALAMRHNGDSAQLAITLRNGGERSTQREVTLYAGGQLLRRWGGSLDGGGSAIYQLHLETLPAGQLTARLTTADALPLDDELNIPATRLRAISFALFGECSPYLGAALGAHPALEQTSPDQFSQGLRVVCAPASLSLPGPTIVVSGGPFTEGVPGDLRWSVSAELSRELAGLTLHADWVLAASLDEAAFAGESDVLLSAGDRPLITLDRRQQVMHVAFDPGYPPLVRQPEYPLLVSWLVEQLLGINGAGEGISALRHHGEEVIISRPLPALDPARTSALQADFFAFAPFLIIIALAFLALDILLLLLFTRRRLVGKLQMAPMV